MKKPRKSQLSGEDIAQVDRAILVLEERKRAKKQKPKRKRKPR